MSLHDVILSLLREPMAGTDLLDLFQGTIGHFWTTDLSQIYRSLEALEREGCVRRETVPSPRGPARKVYRLTPRGRARLVEWVRRPPRIPRAKFEYLAQLFSVTAEEHPAERAREILSSLRGEAAGSLAVLEAIDTHARQFPGDPAEMPGHLLYPWMTMRHGLHRRRALVEWIDECLALLERRPGHLDDGQQTGALGELLGVLEEMTGQAEVVGKDGDE